MKSERKTETRQYQSFTEDFVVSKNQSYQLPKNYVWVHNNVLYIIASRFLYLLALLFTFLYCRFSLHVKIKNRSVLRQYRKYGFFLYGNHTQPIGDAFIPARVLVTKHIYVVASPANLGIPILGPLLPMLGALPRPDSFSGIKKFHEAIRLRIAKKNCVVIYPEAHVWPWYTGIRPFSTAPFGFPVEDGSPSFCITTTYQQRKHGKKPGITIYVDGPFFPDGSLSKKKQKEKLRDAIHDCMELRSRNSKYQYIRYERRKLK
jgi:hypothetical protein